MKRIRCNFPLIIHLIIIGLLMVVPVVATVVPAGIPDPDFSVDIYKPDKVWSGTTLFADYHTPDKARIVEVNMNGEIVWQYWIPDNLKRYVGAGLDVELLPNNNILLLLPRTGVYEINRHGTIVWSYLDNKVSHDADRLPNGNTLINWGNPDTKDDAQVKEVNPEGKVVWSWHAKDSFDNEPYKDINFEGWSHANAVERLPNGNTLINFRNFNLTVQVNPKGMVVWQYDWSRLGANPHEPMLLSNGNLLISLFPRPWQEVEIDCKTGAVVWRYILTPDEMGQGPLRDVDRLPNGNTLINAGNKIIEITPDKEIVWQLRVKDLRGEISNLGYLLYKSERISYMDPQFSIASPQEGTCSPKETGIVIQYSDFDLNSIWYRVYDRTKNTWVTDNITYVRNKWANSITFEGKETGQQKITLEEGNYTLYVWAASTGWGDENLYTPKVINIAECTMNFSVTANCAAIKLVSSTPVSSSMVSGTSLPGITTAQSMAAPRPWAIALSGIIVFGFIVKMRKNRTGKS